MDNKTISTVNSREKLSLQEEVCEACDQCATQCVDGIKEPIKELGTSILNILVERLAEWAKDKIHQFFTE